MTNLVVIGACLADLGRGPITIRVNTHAIPKETRETATFGVPSMAFQPPNGMATTVAANTHATSPTVRYLIKVTPAQEQRGTG